jgi:hypothetical protein
MLQVEAKMQVGTLSVDGLFKSQDSELQVKWSELGKEGASTREIGIIQGPG